MDKEVFSLFIMGFLIVICLYSVLADTDIPCDARGPYIGIAEVVSGGKVVPVYFENYANPPGPSQSISYYWYFGDGEYGLGRNPVHEYTEPGEYNVLMEVNAPPYGQANDSTTATIYSNNWQLTCDLLTDKILVYKENYITFRINVYSSQGQYDDSPPFEIVLEIWDANPNQYLTEIYRHYCEPISPGGDTGWHEFSYRANLEPGWYYCRGKVVFPNGLEYELCNSDFWSFRVWQLQL